MTHYVIQVAIQGGGLDIFTDRDQQSIFLGAGRLNFENLYFWGTGHSCCIFGVFKYFKVFHIFNSIFGSSFIHQMLQIKQSWFSIIIISCLTFAK